MRTTKLFAAILVAGLIASACQQDPDYVLPAIKVESDALDFTAGTEQTLAFTATRDWRVLDAPEWVTVTPDKGDGSTETQRVRVSVTPNAGYNRTGEFVLTIGLDKARVAVSQPGAKGEVPVGTGTKEDPYTVTGVLRYIETLGADVESPNDVYVKGKISAVTEAFSAQYGNATFEMLSEAGEKFIFFRGLYLGNKKWTANDTQIKVDDEVVICGKVINYKGNTPETQQNKAYIYSLNGETQGSGGGGGETSEVKTVTVAEFNAAAPSQTQKYQLTGKVTGSINTQYGNFDLEDATGKVYVYGLTKTDLGYGVKNDESFASLGIKEGDTVTLIGYRGEYNGKIEVMNAYHVSHTSGSGGGQGGNNDTPPSGDTASGAGTLASPYNAAAANAAAAKLTWTDKDNYQKSDDVYIKGKICEVKYTFDVEHGTATFFISDDGKDSADKFQCYSVLYLGNKNWVEGNTQIKVNDEVIICGKLVNYQGKTPETAAKEAFIYSLNDKTE